MKTYLYTVDKSSFKRGFNRTVCVYRIKNNQPLYIGCDDEINTAAYKGDLAIASNIINRVDGHKMDASGYELVSKSIKVIGI
ncbi:hypothetical protein VPDG_00143 [Vibrio phage henriette 12B8]|uniref:hypothetical protein n=1 Tax=Vibrio phage henriette 12B8 TaxID=573174 RepID=UPI0002C1037E|nr:hypothetical protein VPDG_00143 [Vibrio phage henriette 12B8]AGG58304.1 hypothetical protein VPDG_00143 [Vibrio phage henriette 12B8]